MRVANSQLKAFVLDAGVVKKDDLDKTFAEAEKKETYLGALLVEKKLISEDDLKKLEAYILGIPFVNLEKEAIPPDVLMIIPELIAKKHNIVAFKKTGNDLQVAMLDPDDIQTIEFIKKVCRRSLERSLSRILPTSLRLSARKARMEEGEARKT